MKTLLLAALATLLLVSAPAYAVELYDGSEPTTGTNSHEVITTIVGDTECRLDDDTNDDVAAINSLNAFINAAMARSGNSITEAEAAVLIASANTILAKLALPCEAGFQSASEQTL